MVRKLVQTSPLAQAHSPGFKVVGMPHQGCAASGAIAGAGVVVFEEIWDASAMFFVRMTFAASQAAIKAAFATMSRCMPLCVSVAVPEVPSSSRDVNKSLTTRLRSFSSEAATRAKTRLHARLGEVLKIILLPSFIEHRTQLVEASALVTTTLMNTVC